MKKTFSPFRLILVLGCFIAIGGIAIGDDFDEMLERIDGVIAKAESRELNSLQHSPWVIMHAVIAFEKNLQVVDADSGRKVNAIKYLCQHAKHDSKLIFRDNDGEPALPTRGKDRGVRSFQVQDHVDQFLMAFADADVPLTSMILAAGGTKFTVADLLAAAKANIKDNQEFGWTLVATATYLPFEEKWTAKNGKKYAIEDLVKLAIERDPRRETEGGPHHLYGVAYVLEKYRALHKDSEDSESQAWAEAGSYLDGYVHLAKQYQREDGSFSADMFRGSRQARSPREMAWATGHTLEWLAIALTAEQLKQDWIRRGVKSLVELLEQKPLDAFSDGGLYHAAHALRRYRDKMNKSP